MLESLFNKVVELTFPSSRVLFQRWLPKSVLSNRFSENFRDSQQKTRLAILLTKVASCRPVMFLERTPSWVFLSRLSNF